MTKRKFKKIVSEYFEIEKIEKIGKQWFSAWAKSKFNSMKDAPNFQVQYKDKMWRVGGHQQKSLDKAYISWLEGNREYLGSEKNKIERKAFDYFSEWRKETEKTHIIKIIHNKKKATTVVWFLNGDIVKVKRQKGTKDDIYTAITYAITKQIFKSNSQFQRCVDECLGETK